MGEESEVGLTRLAIVRVLVIVLVLGFVGHTVVAEMGGQLNELEQHCDEQYGEDGWVLVPGNSSERPDFYIGQVHVCVDENSSRADRHTE